jgi:peptidoglycan/LPS O-acetylase OafA/YrhL
VIATAGGLLVVAAAVNGHRWFEGRTLVWLGGISYALYLWNYPLAWFADNRAGGSPAARIVATFAGLGLAAASQRLVERPFTAWARRRWVVLTGAESDRPTYSSASNATQPVAPVAESM